MTKNSLEGIIIGEFELQGGAFQNFSSRGAMFHWCRRSVFFSFRILLLDYILVMYQIGQRYLVKTPKVFYSMRASRSKTPLWLVWILAVLLLIFSGVTYRVLTSSLKRAFDTSIKLPVPSSAFPTNIGNWSGGDPARYVAQVQISSVLENSVRSLARDITDLVLDYLPDKNGKIQAVEYSNIIHDVLK